MTDKRLLAGCVACSLILWFAGCGDRKGDLGAERQDDVPLTPLPVDEAEAPEAIAEDSGGPASEAGTTEVASEDSKVVAAGPAEAVPFENAETIPVSTETATPVSVPKEETADTPQPVVEVKAEEAGKAKEAKAATAKKADVAEVVATEAVVAKAEPAGEDVATARLKAEAAVAVPMDSEETKDDKAAGGGEKPAPKPAEETPEQRAERLLKEARKLTGIQDQAKMAEAEAEYQTGLRLYNDLEYEAARRHLEKAAQLDPSNRKAYDLLRKVRSALGVHTDRIATKIRALDHEYRVRVQASIVAIGNALEVAKEYERKGSVVALEDEQSSREDILAIQMQNLRQAQDRYRRVKEIINYMPPQIDLPRERKVVQESLLRIRQLLWEKQDEVSFLRRQEARKTAELQRVRETELFEARIRSLLEQVEDLYNKGQYSACEKLSLRILQMDPFNGDAENWKRKARAANHVVQADFKRTTDREERLNAWEVVDAAHIPYGDLLVYPPNWDVISRRTEGAAIGKSKVEEQWKKDIRKKLQRKVSFEFVDTPLDEAIAFLRNLADVTMIVDPRVLEAGAPPINLRVTDMNLDLALDWILRLADLSYTLKDHAIYIGKKTAMVEDVELRIYDVSDLTMQIPDFPGPDFNLILPDERNDGGGGAPINPFQQAPAGEQVTLQSIAQMIQNRIRPESWDPNMGTSIEERGGRLVVMQRPEIHELIDRLLNNFRATQKIMVNIESRFLTIREAYLEDIGVEFHGLDPNVLFGDFGDIRRALNNAVLPRVGGLQDAQPGPGNVPWPGFTNGPDNLWQGLFSQVGAIVNHTISFATQDTDTISNRDGANVIRQSGLAGQVTVLNNAQVQAFVRALAVRDNTTTLIAPRLTVFNTQRAHMFVARQQSYVADYEISGDSYDPVVRQFLVGVVLDVKPIVSADRKYVTLEMRPTITELVAFNTRQIDSFTINQGANVSLAIPLSFPIQFPELAIRRVRTTATVPDGGIMLLGGLLRNIKFRAENGVPFLSDLPVVGRLFRWNTAENAKSNLAILVSPRIILFSEEEAKL